jgi:hypothetical protein
MSEDSQGKKSIFRAALDMIRTNKSNRDNGIFNSIPFGLPSLDKHVPGIMRGMQYLITAASGIGKTQLTKFLFVNQPYKFIKDNPNLGIKLRILYFALEESKEEFMLTLISNRLKEKYGRNIGVMQLRGMGNHTVNDEVVREIEQCEDYFAELEDSIEIIDSVSNPTGIYKYVRAYATNNGTHVYRDHTFTHTDPDGTVRTEVGQVYSHYTPNDPNEFVVIITDHLSLLSTEGTGDAATLHGSMTKFSAEYCRKQISKHYNYCVVNVQQTVADKEKQQYTNSGQSIESKLEPSLDALGDCKLTQRDAMIVLALFAPDRYRIEKHMDYDIKVLQDYYRCLFILKNRIGTPNLRLPLLFNGQTNSFAELPKPKTLELEHLYDNIKQIRRMM